MRQPISTQILRYIICLNFFYIPVLLKSQTINYTANDRITPYNGTFRAGVNFDVYRGFTDEDLALLAGGDASKGVQGAGIKALRPGFFEDFAELFGYDSRINAFKYYEQLGMKDHTLIVGFPVEAHRDETNYCAGVRSTVFKNLYEPIWDNGENGTPVNDKNYYALYIWKTATRYKNHVKFWEVWNEPGFDYTGGKGWLPKGAPGNWWENNPEPCDYKLRAPIFTYVRMLRITYEVVKTLDPSAYVVTSGVGYPSFLDAILRNTDNPDGGKVTPQYPLKGGAYFEGIGYHAYPHFDDALRAFNNQRNDFDYFRHSDMAATDPARIKNQFQDVLKNYGYNGAKYPDKLWLITECHLPRKEFGQFIGSSEAQKNFMPKAYVNCVKNNILQFHVFKIAEETDFNTATYEFDVMGLYNKIHYSNKLQPEITDAGISYRTTSQILFGLKYDSVKTKAMQLPSNIDGGAFKDEKGVFTYILWAKTTKDKVETVAGTYSFPSSFNMANYIKRDWDFSKTRSLSTISASNIALTGTPIFLTESKIKASAQFICEGAKVDFEDLTPSVSRTWTVQLSPNQTVTETAKTFSKTFNQVGNYTVSCISKDASGATIAEQVLMISVEKIPTVDFILDNQSPIVKLKSTASANTAEWAWTFSDGTVASLPEVSKVFYQTGNFNITLVAKNRCGAPSITKSVKITAPSAPIGKTANVETPQYNGSFRAGVNMRFTEGWTDEQVADIAAGNLETGTVGVGAKSLRTSLPEYFTKFWGSDVRLKTFQHFSNLDLKDMILTIGNPDSTHRDPNFYCFNEQSSLFKNMYQDIWDNGADGTPVNDSNYLARYVYDLVKMYKNEVKFWEVWDTPGWDIEGKNGWKPRNWQHNWWENNPDPCELGVKAPIQHIVRMMRIVYEVVKKEDPTAYVVLSGSGFASFTDAILRNTDNPTDGKVTLQYPNGGGAYFDAVLYNVFPHFDGSLSGYDPAVGSIVYRRHSDAASMSIVKHKTELDTVLTSYGYNGAQFPKKKFIIGEINVPRKPLGTLGFGNDEIQKNFILKSYIIAATNDILSMNIKSVSEEMTYDEAADASQIMGLYRKLNNAPFNRTMNIQGVAFKSISNILHGLDYDSVRTKALGLNKNQRGAAFKNKSGQYVYALWAVCQTDMVEFAKDTFNFPNSLNINSLYKREWSFSETNKVALISAKNIALTGTPVFLSEELDLSKPPVAAFTSNFKKACPNLTVKFEDKSTDVMSYTWRFEGGTPAISNEKTPSVVYTKGGKFNVELEVKNAQGTHINRKVQYIVVDEKPKADFSFKIENGLDVRFTNNVTNSFSMIWDFGDGSPLDQTLSPTHRFKDKKAYTVKLIAVNDCGRDSIVKIVDLLTSTQDIFEAQRLDFQSFPNPFSDDLTAHFNLPESSTISIDLFDIQGRKVENLLQNQPYTEGGHQVALKPHVITQGIYYLQLRTDKVTVYRKILKL